MKLERAPLTLIAVRDVCVKWIFLQGRSGLTRYVTGVLWLPTR